MISHWCDTVVCLYVRLSVTLCIVAKLCILQQKCWNKCIESADLLNILKTLNPLH